MPTKMPFIPLDIIHCIINEVADHRTLQRCALVAEPFRSPAQKRIYSSLNLSPSTSAHDDRIQKLHEIIIRNPLIGTYVQSLFLDLPTPRTAQSSPILRLFPCLRALRVLTKRPQWSAYPDEVRADVYHLLQSPNLQELTLQHIDGFPIDLLVQCALLKRLTLKDMNVDHDTSPVISLPGSNPAHQGRPRSLSFLWASDIITPFLHSCLLPESDLDLSQLYRFEALPASSNGTSCEMKKVLNLCENSLEIFTFPSERSTRKSLMVVFSLLKHGILTKYCVTKSSISHPCGSYVFFV